MEQTEREQLVRSYLLGELPEQAQEVVEIRLLNDPEYFDEFVLVEDELTEDFIFGNLPEHQAKRVWDRFTPVPEHRNRLKALKAIKHYISRVFEDDADLSEWEKVLKEADNRRQRLHSLIVDDWTGLKVLVQIRAQAEIQQIPFESRAALRQLIDAGLVKSDNGHFRCTTTGIRILGQLERSLNLSLSL